MQHRKPYSFLLTPFFLAACAGNPVPPGSEDVYDPAEDAEKINAYLDEHPESCYRIRLSENEQIIDHNSDCEHDKQMTEVIRAAFETRDVTLMHTALWYLALKDETFYRAMQRLLQEEEIIPLNRSLNEAAASILSQNKDITCKVSGIIEEDGRYFVESRASECDIRLMSPSSP